MHAAPQTVLWLAPHFKRKDYAKAVVHLEEASGISPANGTIWYHLGETLYASQNVPAAKAALNKAVTLSTGETLDAAKTRLQQIR